MARIIVASHFDTFTDIPISGLGPPPREPPGRDPENSRLSSGSYELKRQNQPICGTLSAAPPGPPKHRSQFGAAGLPESGGDSILNSTFLKIYLKLIIVIQFLSSSNLLFVSFLLVFLFYVLHFI